LGLRYHAEEGVEILIPSVFRADGGREEAVADGGRGGSAADLSIPAVSDTPEPAGIQASLSSRPAPASTAAPLGTASVTSAPSAGGGTAADPAPGKAPAPESSSPFERPAEQEAEAPATSTETPIVEEADASVVETADAPAAEPAPAAPAAARAGAGAGTGGAAASPVGSQGEHALFAALEESCLPAAVDAVRRLYHIARDRGRELQWGHGDHPAVTAVYEVDGKPVGVWSCYTDLKPSFVVNFEWLAPHIPIERLQRLADRLSELPSVPERLAGLAEAGYKRRLALAVNAVLAQPGAADVINSALTELIDPEAAKAAAAAGNSVPPPPPGGRR
ncbi:MAG TPA: hypothetical protein VG034_25160, partial [Acidimicrobiia bacterium]|nr:hypothetical protein [Acidimicrobiia bacterium]